jgi:CDP-diacylglycerol--glycerol-3-phosphate 3-phosphatidyltransferase
MTTLADKFTLVRLFLAPVGVAAWLALPTDYGLAFWGTAVICAVAEATDWLDGKVARARKEVSDFGKLADPFCDVIYRLSIFLVLLLPPGLAATAGAEPANAWWQPLSLAVSDGNGGVAIGLGLMPFLPVLLMVIREVIAGALRSMCATKGLVLAARNSGKLKAWIQGMTLISVLVFPAFTAGVVAPWMYLYAIAMAWLCAILSIASMAEYIYVNRGILAQLTARRPMT